MFFFQFALNAYAFHVSYPSMYIDLKGLFKPEKLCKELHEQLST